MHEISPVLKSTIVSSCGHEWLPRDFDALLSELYHIVSECSGDEPAPLFRGQSDYSWPLDCKFVRSLIHRVFGLRDHQTLAEKIRRSIYFHKCVLSMHLLKFGVLGRPSAEAFAREKDTDIDAWYEFLKHCQQYPETDRFIPGTFLTDWTISYDIAMYFANEAPEKNGAVWICDSCVTGKVLQVKKLSEIFKLMGDRNFDDDPASIPLIVHPRNATFQPRAANQQPIYVAQMDYRYPIEHTWMEQERSLNNELIFVKLILPPGSSEACNEYLRSKGITQDEVYPE